MVLMIPLIRPHAHDPGDPMYRGPVMMPSKTACSWVSYSAHWSSSYSVWEVERGDLHKFPRFIHSFIHSFTDVPWWQRGPAMLRVQAPKNRYKAQPDTHTYTHTQPQRAKWANLRHLSGHTPEHRTGTLVWERVPSKCQPRFSERLVCLVVSNDLCLKTRSSQSLANYKGFHLRVVHKPCTLHRFLPAWCPNPWFE